MLADARSGAVEGCAYDDTCRVPARNITVLAVRYSAHEFARIDGHGANLDNQLVWCRSRFGHFCCAYMGRCAVIDDYRKHVLSLSLSLSRFGFVDG